jgi:hypothetical protein
MPKGLDIDKIVAEALRRLGQSGVADDVARVGGNMVDDISKVLSEVTGKTPKPKKPKMPKSPPKSGRSTTPAVSSEIPTKEQMLGMGKTAYEKGTKKGLNVLSPEEMYYAMQYAKSSKLPQLASARGTGSVVSPKGPKPKGPKSGSADKMDREARREMNRANWAKEREAYNKKKAIEREERKAGNRAKWAATLEEKYGGNIVEARKATSRGRNRNKKKDAK